MGFNFFKFKKTILNASVHVCFIIQRDKLKYHFLFPPPFFVLPPASFLLLSPPSSLLCPPRSFFPLCSYPSFLLSALFLISLFLSSSLHISSLFPPTFSSLLPPSSSLHLSSSFPPPSLVVSLPFPTFFLLPFSF